jgi:hypothetical protein
MDALTHPVTAWQEGCMGRNSLLSTTQDPKSKFLSIAKKPILYPQKQAF